jgi:predicted ATP-dependent protease
VTGSLNQHGQVQAIGGVNEKIEGYFDICQARGLSGSQGVVIPAANAVHLMLRQDVLDAVAQGQFRVYSVETIDQALQLLTGFSAASIDSLILARLEELDTLVRKYADKGEGKHGD